MSVPDYSDKDETDPSNGCGRPDEVNEVRSELGLPPLRFEYEDAEVPVDTELINALAMGQLEKPVAARIRMLVDRFRSWNLAFIKAKLEIVSRDRSV